ncbi:D-xylulose 5-phosphate/D-fructose 6-phosphate phosphoketolase [Artomyces pyxidatus]|uniref:D-xylulose 5-phosphate/D-fructose 6-phosphate phosphoketolase n=1 Tax=Artomyces pyxidatus TaxID=48021 RepID=A0ACB8TFH5_9AGAM|nr:D-xylulose 5-phosphate/D-fructose 6-phosphate phosphoketolase [Artomyces pyxidatus]
MPGQELATPNPPPDPSQLPDSILTYKVQLDTKNFLDQKELHAVQAFRRAADYIAAAMIFLKDNTLLERQLTPDDIKHRLLGHWGTCPGLVMVYAHLNRIIRKTGQDALYVVGPGHGAPAILSCLWLENSLAPYMTPYTRDKAGLEKLISAFSIPGGFPSHINAQTPGSIHEGGELGYALGVSFGAVMDNPDLIVTCIVGDGEAETGPTATAWHGYKYIDPAESGAVLPIVHVNGFKISERTIYGTMDDKEMTALFSGYGYQVRFVEDLENIDQDLAASMEWAVDEIHKIQKAARSGHPIVKPRWPVLILRTPKGWGGPKSFHGEFIEGSFHSHQVPLPEAKTNPEQLSALGLWLKSYGPHELFDKNGAPTAEILSIIPEVDDKKLGQRKESNTTYHALDVPDWKSMAVEKGTQQSCMKVVGEFLHDVVERNASDFRIFSPDELISNKLDAVLRDSGRNFQWDIASRAKGGRVIEILSEHTCQAMLQGYTLTGRTGLFPSYEAFLGIIQTMMVQYSKFVKMSKETTWRESVGSLNYVETSTWTRQEHNGFSHQNPAFIGAVLNLKPSAARVYLPPDANCFLSTMAHCLRAKDYINLMVGSKQPTPVWLSGEEADRHCIAGASIWKFASVDDGLHPDVVLVGIGVEVTFEVIAAAALLRKHVPALRVRVLNVTDLMILGPWGSHPHSLSDADFDALFTSNRPIHFNYHGYPIELKGLLFGRPNLERVSIEGYREEGTTTSPFDMMLANHTSRYDIAAQAVRAGSQHNGKVRLDAHELASRFEHMAEKDKAYILEVGKDPEGIFDTPVFE